MTERYSAATCPEVQLEIEYDHDEGTFHCIAYTENEVGRADKFKFRASPELIVGLMKRAMREGMDL